MDAWFILIIVYLAVFISSPLIALLHELGHAFAYLIFTNPDKIDIYVGSYGDKKNAINFRLGKIEFYIKRTFPFVKGIGLCSSSKQETNYIKKIIILFAGSVFTLFWAALFAFIVSQVNANDLAKIFFYVFLGFSILSLLVNLIPGDINMKNGRSLENDGKQIIFCLKTGKMLPDYCTGVEHYKKGEFKLAANSLNNVLVGMPKNKTLLRLIYQSFMALKDYDNTLLCLNKLETLGELSIIEQVNKGSMQSFKGRPDEAIATYQAVLKRDKKNVYALNNIAYELIEKGAYEVAQRALDRAVKADSNFQYTYNNIGYSKILQGELEEGKTLIDKYMTYNAEDAYAYKALGIYYLKSGDEHLSLINFDKATELDNTINLSLYRSEPNQTPA